MKTENEFNAEMSKQLKKVKYLKAIKINDRVSEGIADFIVFYIGKSVAFENKFVSKLPVRGSSKLLTHEFAGAQYTFLESVYLSSNKAYGVVAFGPGVCDGWPKAKGCIFYLIPFKDLPKSGNWTVDEFFAKGFKSFEAWEGLGHFLEEIFKW